MHRHPTNEILYYNGCTSRIEVNNRVLFVKPGQYIFIPSETTHSECLNYDGTSPLGTVTYIHTSYQPRNIPSMTLIDDIPDMTIYRLFQYIYMEYKRLPFRSNEIFIKYVELLDLYCLQFAQNYSNPLVKEMLHILNQNLSNPDFCIAQGFSDLGFSIDHLRQLFCKYVGQTPHDYLITRRLSYACQLLTQASWENWRIREVAFFSGFNDPLYFSRLFRKRLGITPTQYIANSDIAAHSSNIVIHPHQPFGTNDNSPYLNPDPSERVEPPSSSEE